MKDTLEGYVDRLTTKPKIHRSVDRRRLFEEVQQRGATERHKSDLLSTSFDMLQYLLVPVAAWYYPLASMMSAFPGAAVQPSSRSGCANVVDRHISYIIIAKMEFYSSVCGNRGQTQWGMVDRAYLSRKT
jgi:hypothetical protein